MDVERGPRRDAILRRLGFDGSPLRRRADRWQAYARILVALLFLVGCVGAAAFGGSAYRQQRAVDTLDDERGYQAIATIVSTSAVRVASYGDSPRYTYRVEWQDKQGNQHLDTFHTMRSTRHEETVTLWVDHRGTASLTPRATGQTPAVAVFKGLTVMLYVAMGLAAAYTVFLVRLNRRRSAEWAAEWDAVEPRWRRQEL